jgi:hypothetical protein
VDIRPSVFLIDASIVYLVWPALLRYGNGILIAVQYIRKVAYVARGKRQQERIENYTYS